MITITPITTEQELRDIDPEKDKVVFEGYTNTYLVLAIFYPWLEVVSIWGNVKCINILEDKLW